MEARTRKPAARDTRQTRAGQVRPAGRALRGKPPVHPGPAAVGLAKGRADGQARPTKQLPAEIESELADLVAATGCELVHAEWKGGTLRLFIDREPSGVSLADCEHVAKLASALLDVLDFGNGRYLLEVSSPGLDRELYRPRDYERFVGRLVRVTYETPPAAGRLEGAEQKPARRTVVARLAEFARADSPAGAGAAPVPRGVPSAGEVTLIDDRTGERQALKLETIRAARLEVEL